ncbi:hypothetical protein MA20_32095 [Bradyrhizobium japonicum]|uniref:Uncharacterized protein n=1 Tax=Bradyrhizobium japonicum TaxID=375 RepID=A0A0A3XRP7_BRAJP|nr:hypothetical protein [Bradyrhizobium japonicum]KGT75831.1 hypothetical protein MA20_32095 [Bradyrhizobium japonicum]
MPSAKPKIAQAANPAIGDYVVRPSYDGTCGARVHRKTGERYDDIALIGPYCETDEGAKALAALLNDARRLARRFHLISTAKPTPGHLPEEWVKHLIITAVARAIDGPRPLPFGSQEAREYAEIFAERADKAGARS